MKTICTICARGGSKNVPNKNIRLLQGKPLIALSILQAKEVGIFETIAVSSDSEEILNIARQWGADTLIRRPSELATDEAPKLPVIQHCVKESEKARETIYETVVDLDPTSPLRSVEDIRSTVKLLLMNKNCNVVTGAPARRSPYFNLVEINERGFVQLSKTSPTPVFRRQDSPKCYDMNASIYVWYRDSLFNCKAIINDKTLLYVMPKERSVDIDSELDFEMVQALMKRNGN